MLLRTRFVAILVILLVTPALLSAQQRPELEKPLKYHEALQRRPSPGYLFDRFYNNWLDVASLSDLEEFLQGKVEEGNSSSDRLLLAFFYAKQGQEVQALEQFRLALENDPGNAATLYEKASVEAKTLDFDTALNDLAKAAASNPKPEEAIKIAQLQGKLYVRNQENEKAIEVWKALIAANPQEAGLMEDVIELQIAEGLFDEASVLSEQLIAITKDPYQKVIRRLRKGDIYQRSGDREKALGVYGETLAQVGSDTWLEREILGQIEQLFRRQDDLVGLSEHYQKLVKAEGSRIAVRKAIASLQFELGQIDQAIGEYQEILKLTPGDRKNREAFIGLLSRAEKYQDALKQTESLIKQYPEDAELQISLAELSFKATDTAKVNSAIDSFIRVSGENEYAYMRAGKLMERFENKEKAQSIYQQAAATFPESDSVRESLAAFLYKNDQKEQAIGIWKALAQDADRSRLVRIARIVSTQQEHQVAFQLLNERFDDFKLDTIFLGQLCSDSLALKKFQQAIPWTISRVRLSKTVGELDNALTQAVQAITRANQMEVQIEQLKTIDLSQVPMVCLVSELFERSNQELLAEKWLADSLQLVNQADATNEEDKRVNIQMLWRQKVRLYKTRQDWQAAAQATVEMIGLAGGRNSVNIREAVDLYMRAGDYESSLNWISEWKSVSPGSITPWLKQAMASDRLGESKKAIDVLRAATLKFPKEQDLHAQLADRYLRNAQYNDAERICWRQYDESETLSDKLRWSLQLATLSEYSGKTAELITRFEERKRNNPESIEPLLALAQVHRVADNYEERRIALLEATRIQKENLPLLLEIARLEESEGNWGKAIETLEKASELDKTTGSQRKIAQLYIKFGESEKGFARLFEIAGGANSDAQDVELIAKAIVTAEEWEQAREFLLPQVAKFKDDYRLRYLLAAINLELGLISDSQTEFLKLANTQTEIKRPSNSNSTGFSNRNTFSQNEYLHDIRAVFPTNAIPVIEQIMSLQEFDIRYGRSAVFSLPNSVDDCRRLALTRLLILRADLNEDEQVLLNQQLKDIGVVGLDILHQDYEEIEANAIEWMDQNLDDEVALSIGLFFAEEFFERKHGWLAFQKFKNEYPQLAIIAALELTFDSSESNDSSESIDAAFDEAIELAKGIKKPSAILVEWIAQTIAGLDVEIQDQRANQIEQLNGLLLDWYTVDQVDPTTAYWLGRTIQQSLMKESSADRLVQFMDQQILVADKNSSASQAGYGQYISGFGGFGRGYYGSRQSIAVLPNFPPDSLVSFPNSVYQMIDIGVDPDEFDHFDFDERPQGWTSKLGESIDNAKNPILKLLLQIKLAKLDPKHLDQSVEQQFANVVPAIQTMLASERPDVDVYYLAACLATHQLRFEDASNLFERMRSLPMNREMRQKIDWHLVSLATQGLIFDSDDQKNQKVFNSAKSAALRLRRVRMSAGERESLLSVLETLGLSKEAEKMEERIAQSANMPGGGVGVSVSKERIAEFVDSGKTDAAVRLLIQEFRGIARSSFAIDSINDNDYEIRDFKDKILTLGLKDELLEQLQPQDASERSLSTFALAHEFFGDEAIAREYLKKSLTVNENKHGVRFRLLVMELDQDPNAFAKHFVEFPKRIQAQAGLQIQRSVRILQKLDTVLELAEQINRFLDTAVLENTDVGWLPHFLNQFANNLREESGGFSSVTLHSVYIDSSVDNENSQDESKQERELRQRRALLTARRIEIHDQLARKMIDIPSSSSAGFTALLKSKKARGGKVGDEFVEYARTALKSVEKTNNQSASQNRYYGSFSTGFGSTRNASVESQSPLEFLAEYFGKSSDQNEALINQIVSDLKEAKQPGYAQQLQDILAMYHSPPDQFKSVAKQYLESRVRTHVRDDDQERYQQIVQVWSYREEPNDIEDLLLEKQKANSGDDVDQKAAIVHYLQWLCQQDQQEKATEFLQRYRTSLLGDFEDVVELVKQVERDSSGRRNSTKGQLLRGYTGLLSEMLSSKDTFFLALQEAKRLDSSNALADFEHDFLNTLLQFDPNEIDQFVEWSRQFKFFGDLPEFDPISNSDREGFKISYWVEALRRLRYGFDDDDLKKALVEYYAEQSELAFGEKLFLMGLKGELRSGDLYGLLGQNIEAFETLPEEKQRQLSSFVNQLDSRNSFTKLTGDALVAKRLINKNLGDGDEAKIQSIMEAKKLSDLSIDSYQLENWVADIVERMDKTEPEKIAGVMAKINQLVVREQKLNLDSFGGSQNDTNTVSTLLRVACEEVDYESFQLVLLVLGNSEIRNVDITYTQENLIQFLVAQMATPSRQLEKDVPKLKAFDAFFREFGQRVGEQDISCLISCFDPLFSNWDDRDLERLEEYMALEASSGKFKQHAETWQIVAASTLERRKSSSSNNDAIDSIEVQRRSEVADYEGKMLAILQEESRSYSWRRLVFESIIQDKTISSTGFWQCIDFVDDARKNGVRFDDRITEQLFIDMLELVDDEPFQSKSQKFGKTWLAAVNKRNSNRGFSRDSKELAANAIRVFAKGDNRELVNRFLRIVVRDRFRRDVVLALLENKFYPEARKLFLSKLDGSTRVQFELVEGGNGYYTQKLEDALPEFIKLFPDPGTQLLVQAWLASVSDPEDQSKVIGKGRNHRLSELAIRYPQAKFSSKTQNLLTLILLSRSVDSAEYVAEPLEKLAAKLTLRDMWVRNSSPIVNNVQVVAAHIDLQVRLGNFQPLTEILQEIKSLEIDILGYRRAQLISKAAESIENMISESTTEQIVEMLPVIREVFDPQLGLRIGNEVNLFAHLLAGKVDAFVEQAKEFNKDIAEDDYDRLNIDPDRLWPILVKHLEITDQMQSDDRRLEIVTEVWKISCRVGLNCGSGHFQEGIQESCSGCRASNFGLDAIKEAELLTAKQLTEHGHVLAELGSVDGEIWRQLGKEHLALQQFEKAAECFQKALNATTEEMEQAKENRKFEYAFVLDKLQRSDECQKLLKDINATLLFDENAKRFFELNANFQ